VAQNYSKKCSLNIWAAQSAINVAVPIFDTYQSLKPSTKTIRLPESLIEHLKLPANKRDVPYQSLLKMFLSEKVEEELYGAVK
jgi:predicted DNA binding CopG/RHH family protein